MVFAAAVANYLLTTNLGGPLPVIEPPLPWATCNGVPGICDHPRRRTQASGN